MSTSDDVYHLHEKDRYHLLGSDILPSVLTLSGQGRDRDKTGSTLLWTREGIGDEEESRRFPSLSPL